MNKGGLIQAQLEYLLYTAGLLSLWLLPLMGGARYEAALATGIWGALYIPVVTALTLKKLQRKTSLNWGPLKVYHFGLVCGLKYSLILLTLAGLHHVIWGTCEPFSGFMLLLLGPAIGALVGATWGALIQGLIASRLPKLSNIAWLFALISGPLVSAAFQLRSFYLSPLVYFYDHFVGYFAGPVYDSIDYRLNTLLWFRVETISLLVSSYLFCHLISGKTRKARVAFFIALLLTASTSLALRRQASELGYRRDHSFSEELPLAIANRHCKVRFSYAVKRKRAELLLEECAAHQQSIAEFLELPDPIVPTVFLFAHAQEKQSLMGAGRTQIAKPWRGEIYLTTDSFPHPILGHELAHALSKSIGQGPLKVAGHLGGLVPDPGRIEGLAVASSPHFDAIGSTNDWAAELLARKKLPKLSELFQLGFFTLSASSSYIAAGSFVEFIVENYSTETLKQWYGGQDLEALTKKSYVQLQTEWHQFLKRRPRSLELSRAADLRFQQRSIFQRTCPHLRDRLVKKAMLAARAGFEGYKSSYDKALSYGAHGEQFRTLPALCALARGETQKAADSLDELLQNQSLTPQERSQAALKRGDLAWLNEQQNEAKNYFESALGDSSHPDAIRNLKLRIWALQNDADAGRLLQEYLLAHLDKTKPQKSPFQLLGSRSDQAPEAKALSHYLIAKARFSDADYAVAQDEMARSLKLGLPLRELTIEAKRIAALSSWAQCLILKSGQQRKLAQAKTNQSFSLYLSEELSSGELSRGQHWARLASQCFSLEQRN